MVKKRGPNKWLITIYLGRGADGKKKNYHETFYAPVKILAQEREFELKKQLKSQPAGPAHLAMTLGEFMDTWLRDVQPSLAASTYDTYVYLSQTVKPFIGALHLWTLTAIELSDALRGRFEHMSPRSRRNLYAFTKTVVRAAIDEKRAPQDALIGFKMPKTPRVERETLNREDLSRLIKAVEKYRYGLVIRLLALTGARAGEILGLTWSAVNFNHGSITINKTTNARHTERNNDRPKTENSRRTIFLDAETMCQLRLQKEKQNMEMRCWKAQPIRQDDIRVFLTRNGKPPSYTGIRTIFAKALEQCGLRHMRVHDLRHSVITLLLTEGNSLVNVASLVGQDVNTTTGKYTHLLNKSTAISLQNEQK